MVLYDPDAALRLREFGILIPVEDSRADRIAESVESGAARNALPVIHGVKERIGPEDVARVHDAAYQSRLFGSGLDDELIATYELLNRDGSRNRWEPERASRSLAGLLERALLQAAGTYEAALLALDGGGGRGVAEGPGFCFWLGGGMHHARKDGGSGFCLLNDIMIAIARLRSEGRVGLVWIIDLDAHKGDGTAEVALGDPETIALSIHMARGWPLDDDTLAQSRAEGRLADRAPFAPSDIDIGIPEGGEEEYVPSLAAGLARMELLSSGKKADLALVVDGADPYEADALPSSGLLKLSLDQCAERDALVLRFLEAKGIPSAWVMAGGYGERAWEPPARFLADFARRGHRRAMEGN